jgi:hypothetical protein
MYFGVMLLCLASLTGEMFPEDSCLLYESTTFETEEECQDSIDDFLSSDYMMIMREEGFEEKFYFCKKTQNGVEI